MENKYILKKGDYYLSDILIEGEKLKWYEIDSDLRLLFDDFEKAEDTRKLIFIETGLDLEIKKEKFL